MKELLLIGVGLMGRRYVAAARRLGVRVVAVDSERNAPSTAGLVDRLWTTSGDSDEAWVAAAYGALAEGQPDGVVGFSEPQVLAAALVQDSLGLPGPSLRAAVLSRNKALQRGCFQARGVLQPEHVLVPSLAEGAGWSRHRLPVVVKPLSGSGSEGVELLADGRSLEAAVAGRAGEGRVLVERAVEGDEYSWEGLVCDGEIRFGNITAKETTGPPQFVETCHRAPADLGAGEARRVDELAAEVVKGLGMRTGIVHLEFRLSAAGPALMEVAVRMPGDFIMDVLSLAYGFDWFEMVVRLALGLPLGPLPAGPAAYCASLFVTAEPGRVVGTSGLSEARALPGVVAADVEVAPGDLVAPLRSSADRVGWALLRAGSRSELTSLVRKAQCTLVVQTRPGGDEAPWAARGVTAGAH